MRWQIIEQMARSLAPEEDKPAKQKQFFFSVSELAVLLGVGNDIVRAFLCDASVPHYTLSKTKLYFLPEVLEAVERTRWKDKETRGRRTALASG